MMALQNQMVAFNRAVEISRKTMQTDYCKCDEKQHTPQVFH